MVPTYSQNVSGECTSTTQRVAYDDALRMADTVIAVINQTTVGPNGEQSEWVRQLAVIVRQLLFDDAPNISGLRAQAAEITTEIFNADRKKCVSGL